MSKANKDIRKAIKDAGIYQYEVAKQVNISEPQFVRWLRYELPDSKKEKIFEAINELKKQAV